MRLVTMYGRCLQSGATGKTVGTRRTYQPGSDHRAGHGESRSLQSCKVAAGSQLGQWSGAFDKGQLNEAVDALDLLVQRVSHVDTSVFYGVLKMCIVRKDLVAGSHVHALAVRNGHESGAFLANHIIRMYAAHGNLDEAMQVFTKVARPNRFVWASIILAHARHGQPGKAVQLYREMRDTTVRADNHIYVAVLRACATAEDLASGKEVHADVLRSVDKPNLFVGNCLVDMYSKCGSLVDARQVFDALPVRDVVTWTAMIAGYTQHGLGEEALSLYGSMQREGMCAANAVTYVCLLQACTSIGALDQGKQLHARIQEQGLEADVVVGNCLVDMYAKCGSLDDACTLFNSLPHKNVATWNAMITGYAHHGLSQEALALYRSMRGEDTRAATVVTFVSLLQACSSAGAFYQGKQVHAEIQERGLECDVVVGCSLVGMYAKCGRLEDARRLFDRLPTRNVVTWTAMLNGYAEHSDGQMAINCFNEMCQQGVEPDDATFSCLLVACSHAGLVTEGQHYFKMMSEDYGIRPSANQYNCVVDLLGRAGHLDKAEILLRSGPFEQDVVGWTALLSACKTYGDIERGRRCFEHLIGVEPENSAPYVLLGSLYANAGRWEDVGKVERLRKQVGAWKKPAKACIEVKNRVHEFTVGEMSRDVSAKLKMVNSKVRKEGGHVPQTEVVLKAMSDRDKEDALCGHAEKLALAYGLLNTPDGATLLVTKNLRMCNDCHSSTKVMSRLEKREIIVRDANRVHRFVDGCCGCGDRH